MSASDDYLGRVQAIIWRIAEYVSPDGVASAQRLVDHGEPSEGMLLLAWLIVNEDVSVPDNLVRDIRTHGDLVPTSAWPPQFAVEAD